MLGYDNCQNFDEGYQPQAANSLTLTLFAYKIWMSSMSISNDPSEQIINGPSRLWIPQPYTMYDI